MSILYTDSYAICYISLATELVWDSHWLLSMKFLFLWFTSHLSQISKMAAYGFPDARGMVVLETKLSAGFSNNGSDDEWVVALQHTGKEMVSHLVVGSSS